MRHLQLIALAVIFLASFNHKASAQHAQNPSALHPLERSRGLAVDSDGQARDLVSLILKQYGLKLDDEQWEIWVTDDADDTPNAAANFNGKRQIYFNKAFMKRIEQRRKDDWTSIAIAAHEVGHHLGNHVLRPWLRRQLAEREADYHAGFVLARMGADYDNTIDVVRWLPGGTASDYPSREQRLCEIGRGWRDGKKLEPIIAPKPGGAGALLQICESAAPDPKQFKTRVNRDIYGNDILIGGKAGIPGIELSACAARCQDMAECKAFSFDHWHGWCFLKSKISPSLTDPPSTIGVKQPESLPGADQQARSVIQVVRNRRFHDTPREPPREADNFDACKERCRAGLNCVAFSFIKASRMCWMFGKTVGHYIDELADSGYKRQLSPARPE